ncbi:hypothetical protein HanRHA438_Chr07g0305261 [Helianthus annuus]|nr:hypothetical protein HanIR_Chr07g0318361 [Helianthus annuus]KAJ0907978.1 hypothetical protein HanRHA438_Chr07g0305261 [Helianthus annuus]
MILMLEIKDGNTKAQHPQKLYEPMVLHGCLVVVQHARVCKVAPGLRTETLPRL